jgi:hypothetical protein
VLLNVVFISGKNFERASADCKVFPQVFSHKKKAEGISFR